MTWLVTGGAGYIGSHLTKALQVEECDFVVVDDLSTGRFDRVSNVDFFYQTDIRDFSQMRRIFERHSFQGVFHLAAKKNVSESVRKPHLYREVNENGTRNLAELAAEFSVKYFVNSSSAAVYGNSTSRVVNENSVLIPISPYGNSKLNSEKILTKTLSITSTKFLSLRYFNVGGSESPLLTDTSVSNLIPIVVNMVQRGEKPLIFGNDYQTNDGTCVRDYVHVSDVVNANIMVMKSMINEVELPQILNIGSGVGNSVLEVIDLVLKESGSDLKPLFAPRREGDPEILVADISNLIYYLNFKPQYQISDIVRSSIDNI
jgi:UDP-glucose 4-epimerase